MRLLPVLDPTEWKALHRLRQEVLFRPERLPWVYDPNHPDDRQPCHTPLILWDGEVAVGCARLDRREGYGILRLVAIAERRQGQGLGRALDGMVTDFARSKGLLSLRVNAASEAVGFYRKCGWKDCIWDREEAQRAPTPVVQMSKSL
ncbi:MAG: GNAT family N-acetyltransferase [Pseudomonadota bacterium]